MTPIQTTKLFEKIPPKIVWVDLHEVFDFCKMGICYFDQNENGNLSNHLRTLRQQWASSCSLISLLSVKILPWQKTPIGNIHTWMSPGT